MIGQLLKKKMQALMDGFLRSVNIVCYDLDLDYVDVDLMYID